MSVKPASRLSSISEDRVLDSQARLEHLARLAKALGHPARIQIIETLLTRQTCIGCDIVEEIGLAASTTSEHLRILKQAGLIVGETARPRVCYSLNPTAFRPLLEFLCAAEIGASQPLPE